MHLKKKNHIVKSATAGLKENTRKRTDKENP